MAFYPLRKYVHKYRQVRNMVLGGRVLRRLARARYLGNSVNACSILSNVYYIMYVGITTPQVTTHH